MPRKQKKYHYIYKTTCEVTNRYYIGMHSTDNLDDGYMGSGKQLWNSLNYHGKDNHSIEILEWYDTREELTNREREIVNNGLVEDRMCMNLKVGGEGGGRIWSSDHMTKFSKAGNKAFKDRIESDPEFRKDFSERMTELNHKWWSEGMFEVNGFEGKSHTEETKRKISEATKGVSKGKGETNSQYGTCWITKDGENKKIKKNDLDSYLITGWVKGRKMN